jgi:hypothetical protein
MAIGRGRRREHPNQHCLLLLRMLHNFRFRMPKGTPKGSSDHRSHPVAVLLLLRKKRGKKPGMRRTYFRTGLLPVTWLTSLPIKSPTRADMAPFRSCHFRSFSVMRNGPIPRTIPRKCDFVRTHILLPILNFFTVMLQHYFSRRIMILIFWYSF